MRKFAVAVAIVVVALPMPASADSAGENISGTGRALVCDDGTALDGDELEAQVTRDPRNDQRLVAAWIQDDWRAVVTATSSDGGRTWRRSLLRGVTTCGGGTFKIAFNPSLAFADDGTVYLAVTGSGGTWEDFQQHGDPGTAVTRVLAARSIDGGKSWDSPVEIPFNDAANDYPRVAALPTPGSAVVTWKKTTGAVEETFVSRTTDRGRSWTAPAPARRSNPNRLAANRLHAYPDGGLALVTVEWGLTDLMFPGNPAPQGAQVYVDRFDPASATWSHTGGPFEVATRSIGSTVDATGTLHLALPLSAGDDVSITHLSSSDHGATWTSGGKVIRVPASHLPPSIAVDAAGTVAVVTGPLGERTKLELIRRPARGSWQRSTLITTGPLTAPIIEYLRPNIVGLASGFAVVGLVGEPQTVHGPTDVLAWRQG